MKSNESPADRPRLRLSLRSLLIWTIYAAIGMALGSASGPKVDSNLAAMGITLPNLSPFNALLGAASATIAVGLVHQALAIRRQAANWPSGFESLRTGARWEAGLRCALAATIVGCMTIQLLSMRQFLTFPEDDLFFYDDIVTQYLWWLAILIAIADASRRVIGSEPRPRRWLINGFIWFSLFGLATYIVTDHFFIPYLTHLACKGVDVDAPLTFQRYPFTTRAEEWFLFLTTSGAAATIVAAGGLSLRAMARHGLSGLRRPATLATLALLLGTSGGVCYWIHAITRNRLAPDLEDIGFGSSWWQQAGGIAMAAMLTTYVVYLGWRASASLLTTPKDLHASLALPLASENFFALVLLSTTAMLRLGQIIWTNLGEDFLATPMDALGYLPYLVVDPLTYFITAMLILSFQLIRFCWKGQAPAPLVIIPLKSSDFIVAWLILAAIFAVAILTFAAFGFSFWLGPWYRW